MAIIAFVLASIHFASEKKNSRVYEIHSKAKDTIKSAVKRKLKTPKENPIVIARVLIEIAYIAIIVFGIFYLLDPEQQMVNWSGFFNSIGLKFQLTPLLKVILNFTLFAIITIVFLWLYNYSKQFDSLKFRGVRENIKLKRKRRKRKKGGI